MSHGLRREISSPTALFAFEAAARLGSFRRAAAELGIKQPSVSYQIKHLELHLDAKLFHRRGRAVELTADGRTLFRAIESGFDEIYKGLARIRRRGQRNLVTVCASAPLSSFFLMPNLPGLREQHPEIDLSLLIVSRDLNPMRENADFAVLRGDGDFEELDSWKLWDEVIYPLCAPGYADPASLPLSARALLDLELLHLKERFRTRIGWAEFLAATAGVDQDIPEHLSFSDQQPLMEAAMNRQGVALGWAGTTDSLVERNLLMRPSALELRTDKAFYLVAPKEVPLKPHAEHFKHWLLEVTAPLRESEEPK